MRVLLLLCPVLALILLGAHFYRAAAWPLVLACALLVLLLLAWRRTWVLRLVQAALLLGAAEWAWTAFLLVQQRQALSQPWLRLSLILGAVALFTAGSALLLRKAGVRAGSGNR